MKRLPGWVLLGLCLTFQAQATVSLSGTRLILTQGREASIEARNLGDQEVLLQAWLAPADAEDDPQQQSQAQRDLPFVVTPTLLRLPGQGRHLLRVLYQGQGMPSGRESLLHLYVLEIPRRQVGAQQLSIAVRQRINLFYRPLGLTGDPAQAATQLRWSVQHARLKVSNPTAFHVSLLDLQLDGQPLSEYLLLAPGQHADWLAPVPAPQRLEFKALTDYGGQRGYCARPAQEAVVTARLIESSLMAGGC